jgi:(2Fe-2S) ferredoxin
MSFYKKHVFFCTNQKDGEKKCCQQANATAMSEHARECVRAKGLTDVRINKSGCLGRCAEGPCVVVYPEGRWYTYKTEDDVAAIVDSLSTEIPCEWLLLKTNS